MKFCFENKEFLELDITPNKLAIIGDDFELTWADFEESVNTLKQDLTKHNIQLLKHPVIVYGHKSARMIVAIYALMKLEIPYIPIDQIYPAERIKKIVKQSNCELILNTTNGKLPFSGIAELNTSNNTFHQNGVDFTFSNGKPIDPSVYIIFTSGSTGEPKGVEITTSAVQAFTQWMTLDFGFSSEEVFINSAIFSFDLSVFELLTFAAIGGTLLLNNKATVSDPNLLLPRIAKYNGSVWVSTPSFALLYARMKNEPLFNSIKTFLFCGEVLPHALAKNLTKNITHAKIINCYGPTEATVATTKVEITEAILNEYDPLPVGEPKRESELHFEKEEIVIVGDHVSVGYLNNKMLSAEKFTTINGKRAFKTGDKGFLKDGFLFFSGRNDDLVKLHGFRIELNEITSVLNNLSYISNGATIALKRNGSVKKIVSLVVPENEVSIEQMKMDLGKKLPHYMIPADIKLVAKIPLNSNGKADKKILEELYLKK